METALLRYSPVWPGKKPSFSLMISCLLITWPPHPAVIAIFWRQCVCLFAITLYSSGFPFPSLTKSSGFFLAGPFSPSRPPDVFRCLRAQSLDLFSFQSQPHLIPCMVVREDFKSHLVPPFPLNSNQYVQLYFCPSSSHNHFHRHFM